MNETLRKIFRLIADPIIFGNFFVSLCAAGLVLETYVQLGHAPVFDGLAFFVFFSTLALYNFHRLMGVRRIKPEDQGEITGWAAKHQFTLLMLVIIGIGGMGFFFFQLPIKIISVLIPLGAISILYELPLVKYNKRFERIRNLWLSKAFLITIVWGLSTAMLPAMNLNLSLLDYRIWLAVIERVIFILILALNFDARDVIFDQRDGLKTIPIVYGKEVTSRLYRILSAAFLLISLVHYSLLREWGVALAMATSITCTYFVVLKSEARKSDYYYMFLVDGMMLLQFLLVAVLSATL